MFFPSTFGFEWKKRNLDEQEEEETRWKENEKKSKINLIQLKNK